MHPLTYLAQLLQIPSKLKAFQRSRKGSPKHILACITRPFSLIALKENYGASLKEIATIGIAPGAAWDVQNRNTDEWSRDANNLQTDTHYTFSQSPVGERKSAVNTQKKTMDAGLKGYWMRVDNTLHVKVVNGTMFKLQNVKKEAIHTPILSPAFCRKTLAARLYTNDIKVLMGTYTVLTGQHIGLFGLKSGLRRLIWVSSITSQRLKPLKGQVDTSQSTFSSLPFSRLVGLRDGSAYGTLKDFHNRRNNRQMR